MGYGRNDRTYEFEARIEHKAPKSYLVELTLGGRYFVPFSQIVEMTEPDDSGNRVFTVTEWWSKKMADFEVKD